MNEMETDDGFSKIICLGHKGFIGRSICKEIINTKKTRIIGYSSSDVDLTNWNEVKHLESELDAQTVIIMCSGIKRHVNESIESYLENVKMVYQLGRIIKRNPIKRFIFFSSVSVYGESSNMLNVDEKTPVNPISYYGNAKYTSECLLLKLSQEIGFSLGIIRPSIVYGSVDSKEKYGPSAFTKLVLDGKEIVIWGDGGELRDFIHIDDLTKLTIQFTFSDLEGVYNFVSGEKNSFKNVIEIIECVFQKPIKIVNQKRTKPKVDLSFNNKNLHIIFPKYEFTKIDTGLSELFFSMQKQ
jgi:UDP-glucose 4-epimerase